MGLRRGNRSLVNGWLATCGFVREGRWVGEEDNDNGG